MANEINIKPIDDPLAFLERYKDLHHRVGRTSFFLTPQWMSAWLGGVTDNTKLFGVEATSEGQVVAVGAFGVSTSRRLMTGPREAWLHEFGDRSADAIYIEYNDFLILAAHEDKRADIIAAVMANVTHVDVLVFRNATTELAAAVQQAATHTGWRWRLLRTQPVYAVDLSAAHSEDAEIMASFSGSLQRQLRRSMRRYEEQGPIKAVAVTSDDWQEVWEEMTRLHEARWRPGVFSNPALTAFHERLRAQTPESCELLRVSAGVKLIGILYNFVHGGRVMNYQSGFSFEEDNQLKPGFVCHALACQHYQERGYDAYDMLAGEAEYKSRLGGQTTELTSVCLERPNWRNKVAQLYRSAFKKPVENN